MEEKAYAMMGGGSVGGHDVLLTRERGNRIVITTAGTLSDEQMSDLYWVVSAMTKTGKPLKKLIERVWN